MRNSSDCKIATLSKAAGWAVMFAVLGAVMVGCAPTNAGKENLDAAALAMERQQYDQAISRADLFLRQTPAGPGSAEALYLRGRALESRVAANPQEAAGDLQAARQSYIRALELSPSGPLEGYIRTSLGNVAYFQDDYATAAEQWATAYERLDRPDLKAWALYRIGVCQQRLGRFNEADRTFAAVQRQYPDTTQAQRAREHQGQSAFYVQLAAFTSAASADNAIAALRRQGVSPIRLVDSAGKQIIRAGPFASYAQARALKLRFADAYPDAWILP